MHGEVALPQNPLGLAYNEVELTYTAGSAAIPDAVKFACAQIVRNAQATPALNVRAARREAGSEIELAATPVPEDPSALNCWLTFSTKPAAPNVPTGPAP